MSGPLAIVLMLAVAGSPQAVLDDHAYRHGAAMASSGTLYHSDISPLTSVCGWAGENVGRGTTIESIDAAFRASPSHASNLDHATTHRTRSVSTGDDGKLYVVDLFCVALDQAATPTPSTSPPASAKPTQAPIPTALDTANWYVLGFWID